MKNVLILIFIVHSLLSFSQSTEITPGNILPKMSSVQRAHLQSPEDGMLVYDSDLKSYFFYKNGAWSNLTNGVAGINYWEQDGQNGDEIKNINNGVFWSKGSVLVHNNSDDASNPPTAPINEAGTRLMWIPSRAAFRAGTVLGTVDWSPGNIGLFSTTFGLNGRASGKGSFSAGISNIATDLGAVSMGNSNESSGFSSTTFGNNNIASGNWATSFGLSNEASGTEALAFGEFNKAIGYSSVAGGSNSSSEGLLSFSYGLYVKARANYSVSIGDSSIVNGELAMAFGNRLRNNAIASVVFGEYNNDDGTVNFGHRASSDKIFQIGNGSQNLRSNALSILRDARTGINNIRNPSSLLHLKGYNDTENSHIRLERNSTSSYTSIFTNGVGLNFQNSASSFKVNFRDYLGAVKSVVKNDGSLGLNTENPQATLHVNGFTKMGDDAPKMKFKKLTGTAASNSPNSTQTIPHGIGNADKILSVDIAIESNIGQWIPENYTAAGGYEFNFYYDDTNIFISNKNANSSLIASRPVKVLISYEE